MWARGDVDTKVFFGHWREQNDEILFHAASRTDSVPTGLATVCLEVSSSSHVPKHN